MVIFESISTKSSPNYKKEIFFVSMPNITTGSGDRLTLKLRVVYHS